MVPNNPSFSFANTISLDICDRLRQLHLARANVEVASSAHALAVLAFHGQLADFVRDMRLSMAFHSNDMYYWQEAGLVTDSDALGALVDELDAALHMPGGDMTVAKHGYALVRSLGEIYKVFPRLSHLIVDDNLPPPTTFEEMHAKALEAISIAPGNKLPSKSDFTKQDVR